MNIPSDAGALLIAYIELTKKFDRLEKQDRKGICQSCVSMTNQAHNQDCIIEELATELDRVKTELKTHKICGSQLQIDSLLIENDTLRKDNESLKTDVKQWKNQANYYLNLLDSTKQDLAMIQRFVKGIGQANLYGEIFKMEQSK
jgi:hypothetical protein